MVDILPFTGAAAAGTLAQGIAADLETAQSTGLLNAFLMKRVNATALMDTPDVSDTIIVGMARGDATVTEIKAAIELAQVERDAQDQANARVVLHETKRYLFASTTVDTNIVHIDASLGGGKGIPFDEGDGWKWFMYNDGANDQVAGMTVRIMGTYYGVWL